MNYNMDKRFKHDCDTCVFLGQYNEFDLYFCSMGGPTIIARYGNEGGDYHSGIGFAYSGKIVQLTEAFNRTIERDLFEFPLYDFDKDMIDDCLYKIKNNDDSYIEKCIMALYALVYENIQKGLWKNIKSVKGYPKVSLVVTKYMIDSIKKNVDDNKKQKLMNIWLNNGFSTDEKMEDWKVKPTTFILT